MRSALRPVDRLEVCVVVDNILYLLSTVPHSVIPELPNLIAAGATGPTDVDTVAPRDSVERCSGSG